MVTKKTVHESGPPLRDYIETRFSLLSSEINTKLGNQQHSLDNFIESMKDALAATDLRYQQRFEAQSDALSAAFLSQQLAMKTALEAAKEAVQAALAAADRAVNKTELSADKRFESLGELINQRFNTMTDKLDATTARMNTLETRLNLTTGESTGGLRAHADYKSMWSLVVSTVAVLIVIVTAYFKK